MSDTPTPAEDSGPEEVIMSPAEMMVQLTQARLPEYQALNQGVTAMMGELKTYFKVLKDNNFPINFEQTGRRSATITDADGEKVMDLEFQGLHPNMLYPTNVVQAQQHHQAAALGAQKLANPDAMHAPDDDDDEPGFERVMPRLPGPGEVMHGETGAVTKNRIVMSSGPDADDVPDTDLVDDGDEPKPRKGMTVSEVVEAAGDDAEAEILPPGTQMIMFDPTRGLPPSPTIRDGLEVRAYTNIASQPKGMSAQTYNLGDQIGMRSFMAHIADVAAYVKDLHEGPKADRTGDNIAFHPTQGIGFRPGPAP